MNFALALTQLISSAFALLMLLSCLLAFFGYVRRFHLNFFELGHFHFLRRACNWLWRSYFLESRALMRLVFLRWGWWKVWCYLLHRHGCIAGRCWCFTKAWWLSLKIGAVIKHCFIRWWQRHVIIKDSILMLRKQSLKLKLLRCHFRSIQWTWWSNRSYLVLVPLDSLERSRGGTLACERISQWR